MPTKTLLELMSSTLFASPAYQTYGKIIADQSFQPAGFRLKLGFKDLRLALAASEASNVPMPFGAVLRDVFVEAIAHGLAMSTGQRSVKSRSGGRICPAIPRTGNNNERDPGAFSSSASTTHAPQQPRTPKGRPRRPQ